MVKMNSEISSLLDKIGFVCVKKYDLTGVDGYDNNPFHEYWYEYDLYRIVVTYFRFDLYETFKIDVLKKLNDSDYYTIYVAGYGFNENHLICFLKNEFKKEIRYMKIKNIIKA